MPLEVAKSKAKQSLAGYISADGTQSFVSQFRHNVIDPATGIPGVTLTLQKNGPNGIPGEKAGFATAIPAGNPQMLAMARQKALLVAAKLGFNFADLVESDPVIVEQGGVNYARISWLMPSAEVTRV